MGALQTSCAQTPPAHQHLEVMQALVQKVGRVGGAGGSLNF